MDQIPFPGDDDYAEFDEADPDAGVPDPLDVNLEKVSSMLGAVRRLSERIAEYEVLHVREVERLNWQRERVIGPKQRRVESLRAVLLDYAVKSYRDFGKVKIDTPNGTLKSAATLPVLEVDDEVAGQWFEERDPELVQWTPKVPLGTLRAMLHDGMIDGSILRVVVTDTVGDGPVEIVVPPGEEWRRPFTPSQTGLFAMLDQTVEEGRYLPGVNWYPSGTDSVGRNFRVEPT